MYQEFYTNSSHLIWPLLGLVIFVSIFIGVLAYVIFGLRDRDKIDAIAALPLALDSGTDNVGNTAGPGLATGPGHATGRAS